MTGLARIERLRRSCRIGVIAAALLVSAGCDSTGENDRFLAVTNYSSYQLVVFAHADGAVIDPNPLLAPGTYEEDLIPPGQTRNIDKVEGLVPGRSISLFIYVVSTGGARFALSREVTTTELRQHGGVVTITTITPTSPP